METGATPPKAGGGWDTRWDTGWDTPPPCRTAPAVKRGGSLPSLPSPLAAVRVGRSRTNNPNNDSEQWTGGMGHPPRLYLGHPPLCPRPVVPATEPCHGACHGTGHGAGAPLDRHLGGGQADGGPEREAVIAPRAVALVGVPSGSCCNNSRRSAAVSNPPAARKRSRLPAVIACSSRAISWRMSGSALVGPAGSAGALAIAVLGPAFQDGRGAFRGLYARADGDNVHGERPRPERGPEGRVGHAPRAQLAIVDWPAST